MYNLTEKFFLCLAVLTVSLTALQIPDISVGRADWKLDSGVTQNGAELLLVGHSNEYRKAVLILDAEFIDDKPLYFSGEILLSNITPGKFGYHCPKFKVYSVENLQAPAANNISVIGDSPGWVAHGVRWTSTKGVRHKQIRLEIAIQESQGVMRARNLSLSKNLSHDPIGFHYPWKVISVVPAKLHLSGKTKPVSDRLFGLNSHFVEGKDMSWSYSRPEIRDVLKRVGVSALRFPGGTVANWYDFENDSFLVPQDLLRTPSAHLKTVMKYRQGLVFDYPGYRDLVKSENWISVQTFNLLQDSPDKSVRRLKKLYADGVRPVWIELGNENDDPTQQSDTISNVYSYIEKCRIMASSLKGFDPSIQLAVNTPFLDGEWSHALSKESFYDGVVTHPYLFMGFQGQGLDWSKCVTLLTSDLTVKNLLAPARDVFSGKPIILSEWGIITPMNLVGTPIAAFSTALAFFPILDGFESGFVDLACLHIAFGNFMGLAYTSGPGKDDLRLRPYAAVFELITRAFKNSSLFESKPSSFEIVTGIPAVVARGTKGNDGATRVLAVNRANVAVALIVSLDKKMALGQRMRSTFEMTDDPGKKNEISIGQTHLKMAQENGEIILPPLSISLLEWLP